MTNLNNAFLLRLSWSKLEIRMQLSPGAFIEIMKLTFYDCYQKEAILKINIALGREYF